MGHCGAYGGVMEVRWVLEEDGVTVVRNGDAWVQWQGEGCSSGRVGGKRI